MNDIIKLSEYRDWLRDLKQRFFKFYSQKMGNRIIIPIRPQVGGELVTGKVTLIPWGHQKTIIDKCESVNQAFFYINKTIENNWSRAVLEYQILNIIAGLTLVIAGLTRNPLKTTKKRRNAA